MESTQVLYPHSQHCLSHLPSLPCCHSPGPGLLPITCSLWTLCLFRALMVMLLGTLSPSSWHGWPLLTLQDSAQRSLPQKASADHLSRVALAHALFTPSPWLMSSVAFITAFSCWFHILLIVSLPWENVKSTEAVTISVLFTVVSPIPGTKEVLHEY